MAPVLDALDEVRALDHVGPGPVDSGEAAPRDVRPRRCSEPAPEPIVDQPEPDQAVFDAEFVALVLTEYPPTQGKGAPARIPPPTVTRARRTEPSPAPTILRGGRPGSPGISEPREGRRRPGPWPRSPPGPLSPTPFPNAAKEVSGSQEASLCKV